MTVWSVWSPRLELSSSSFQGKTKHDIKQFHIARRIVPITPRSCACPESCDSNSTSYRPPSYYDRL
eukprot:scaffold2476_cov193-Amphora_coffeaeformis.AAC.17